MIAEGFEPSTACLEGRCSIQLSYATAVVTFDRLLRRQVALWMSFEILNFVGVAGFEPATSWSQTRRDDRATLHPATIFLICFYCKKQSAESKGFEPLVQFPVRMFSKHVLSASQATLPVKNFTF